MRRSREGHPARMAAVPIGLLTPTSLQSPQHISGVSPSFVPEDNKGIDAAGAARGEVRRQRRAPANQQRGTGECRPIKGTDSIRIIRTVSFCFC
jgi:hypothetical protein